MVRRLSETNLAQETRRSHGPTYDRACLQIGVVHFGPGAFFRAHTAWHFDRLAASDPRFGVAAFSLRTADAARALAEQDGLYTLMELAETPRAHIVGVLKECGTAQSADRVASLLAAPSTRVVSLTISEKGYCLDGARELDLAHEDIKADLDGAYPPRSAIGWIALGLARRRAERTAPFITMSCDNLEANGPTLKRAVVAFAEAKGEHDLARYIEGEARFPASMVDSITPASDEPLRARVAETIGLRDEAAVQREPFTQWVLEKDLGPDAPDLARAGVTLTANVAAHERAKLRLLNGAHSTLAYLGILAGCETTADAMANPALARHVERLMREDLAATLDPASEIDVTGYIAALLARFGNPAIRHSLRQIATDGSKKLPYRIVAPMADLLAADRPIERPAMTIASWIAFAIAETRAGRRLNDPLSERLAGLAQAATGDAEVDASRFLSLTEVVAPTVAAHPRVRPAVAAALARLLHAPMQLD